MTTTRIRWSDNDRYFGPFTYARDSRGYRPIAMMLVSGDDDDRGCALRLSAFGRTLILALPALLPPAQEWVDTSRYEWSKNPRGGYWDIHRREFGFSSVENALHVHYGRQTHDSSTQKSKCFFYPWRSWRHVRHSFYGLDGEHVATIPDTGKSYRLDPGRFDREREIADATPTRVFAFKDFDGELLTVTTRIEEREWRLGEGKFKWLSWFCKPKISRSLDLRFSGETGRRKGSWKGGTVGHSINMRPGELHEAAFRRYCAENNMTFEAAA